MPNTAQQYQAVIDQCRSLFLNKNKDYGTAWRILRLPSITDQIFIKASRIRTIQQKGTQQVADDLAGEFTGIINYCIMALIQLELGVAGEADHIETDRLQLLYNQMAQRTLDLLMAKNHDYGEAWRSMRISSMTDIILMKLLRTKQIEDNQGQTLVSEGVAANYMDMLNYSVFCLILASEGHSLMT